MSIGALIAGLVALAAVLVAFGAAVGPVELAIWFGLVVAWAVVWFRSRRRRDV